MKKLIFLLLTSVCWTALAAAQIEGDFKKINPLPARNSLEQVRFDEYLNFTCSHCNNFRKAASGLKKKYGKLLKVRYIPVLFRNQPDTPLRLFFIAEAMGRTEEIKNLIFEAAFSSNVNIYDSAVVSYLARSAGLGEQYAKDAHAQWVTQKVAQAQQAVARVGLRATPTVVLENALFVESQKGMQAFVNNLDRLIGQLLKAR